MCDLNVNGKCTEHMAECGMAGDNTCCLSCEKRRNCEDPCEYAREEKGE
jgi:hypothetical protein